jgi:hypothetical protein
MYAPASGARYKRRVVMNWTISKQEVSPSVKATTAANMGRNGATTGNGTSAYGIVATSTNAISVTSKAATLRCKGVATERWMASGMAVGSG